MILMISGFVSAGPKAADRILRGTMLIDHMFEAISHKPELHSHTINREINFDFMTLI